jgi:hypothetical protein
MRETLNFVIYSRRYQSNEKVNLAWLFQHICDSDVVVEIIQLSVIFALFDDIMECAIRVWFNLLTMECRTMQYIYLYTVQQQNRQEYIPKSSCYIWSHRRKSYAGSHLCRVFDFLEMNAAFSSFRSVRTHERCASDGNTATYGMGWCPPTFSPLQAYSQMTSILSMSGVLHNSRP